MKIQIKEVRSKVIPPLPPSKEQTMEKVILKIKKLIKQNFWGEITIRFKNGIPTTIETVKTEKLD